MNNNAAYDSSNNKIGFGIIIRDSSGCVKAVMSKLVRGRYRPQEMEVKAMFHGLLLAQNMNIQLDLIETDSLLLANAINNPTTIKSHFHDSAADIHQHLSNFLLVCVRHVRRDANQAAHGLAKHALM
ncbi:hypothetical protein CsatB_026620 [Cannabis sativa]